MRKPRARESVSRTQLPQEQAIVELPDLLQNLCDVRRTGTLKVDGPRGAQVFMHFDRGRITAAMRDREQDFLGKALVKTRALGWDELAEFMSFHRLTPATLEYTLLEQGRIDEGALDRAHHFAITEVVCETLSWSRPSTTFREGAPHLELLRVNLPRRGLALGVMPLVMEACCRLDEWPSIRARVPSDHDVPVQGSSTLEAEGAAAEVLGLVDGVRDAGEVADLARRARFEALGHLRVLVESRNVRFLDRDELVQLAGRLRGEAGSEAQVRDKLMALYGRAVELGFESYEVQLWLAEAFEARGDRSEASARYLDLGRALTVASGREREAIELFRKALELQPDDGSLQRELIQHLIDQDKLEEAAIQTEQYVDWLRAHQDPTTILRTVKDLLEQLQQFDEMAFLYADLNAEAGSRAQAIRLFKAVAQDRLASDEFTADEKIEALERIVGLDPNDLESRYDQFRLLSEFDPVRALEAAGSFIEVSQSRSDAQPDERLVEACELLRELAPSVGATKQLAIAYIEVGRIDAAHQLLSGSLDEVNEGEFALLPAFKRLFLAARTFAHHRLLALALLRSGSQRGGIKELRALATAAFHAGNSSLSHEALTTALRHDPFDVGTRLQLNKMLTGEDRRQNLRAMAHAAQVTGNLEAAVDALEKLVRDDPQDLLAPLELACCQMERGGPGALEGLKVFALAAEKKENRADLAWAVEEARRLEAPAGWFAGLSTGGHSPSDERRAAPGTSRQAESRN